MPSMTIADMASRTGPMADKPKNKWIKKAVPESHKGKFREKAERADMSTAAYAKKEEHAPGALGKEARLAETFAGMRKKRSPLYDRKKD